MTEQLNGVILKSEVANFNFITEGRRLKMRRIVKDKFHKLEYYRGKYGISQKQMASIIGIGASCYCHKVNKKSTFSLPQMICILEVLNKEAKKAGDDQLTLDDIFLE